jgi:hypothetical protein
VDHQQYPKDWYFGPTKKAKYAFIIHTKNGPRYFEQYELGQPLIDRIVVLWNTIGRKDLKASDESAAFNNVIRQLEKREEEKKDILDGFKKNREKFSFHLRYNAVRGDRNATEAKSLWLFASPVPDIFLGSRVVDRLPAADMDRLLDFLIEDGYFGRAKAMTGKEALQAGSLDYSLLLYGKDKDTVYHDGLQMDPGGLQKLEALRKVLTGQAATEMDAVLKEWAAVRGQ